MSTTCRRTWKSPDHAATDEPPDPGFDLVHARLVLVDVHSGTRPAAGGRARPRGMRLIEDFDVDLQPLACVTPAGGRARANRYAPGSSSCRPNGAPIRLRTGPAPGAAGRGLTDVAAMFAPVALPAAAALKIANVRQVEAARSVKAVQAPMKSTPTSARSPPDSSISQPHPGSVWGAAMTERATVRSSRRSAP